MTQPITTNCGRKSGRNKMRPENSAAGRELGTHQTQTQLSEITTVTPHPEQQITVPRVQLNVYHVTDCLQWSSLDRQDVCV
jgi:hypothetical protein